MTKTASTRNWKVNTLEQYKTHLVRSKAPSTVSAYVADVAGWVETLKPKKLTGITKDHVMKYIDDMKHSGRSDATLNRYYISIRGYLKWLGKEYGHEVHFDKDDAIKAPNRKELKLPSIEETERMMGQPDTTTWEGVRDRAILELLYSSGLRVSELCDLDFDDIGDKVITIRHGKGDRLRIVPVTHNAWDWLQRWLNAREERYFPEGYLFLTTLGRRMAREVVTRMVTHYAKEAGLECVTAHTLRHMCASHLLVAGADSSIVQKLLGHTSILTTQWYMHLNTKQIGDALNEYHPGNKA